MSTAATLYVSEHVKTDVATLPSLQEQPPGPEVRHGVPALAAFLGERCEDSLARLMLYVNRAIKRLLLRKAVLGRPNTRSRKDHSDAVLRARKPGR